MFIGGRNGGKTTAACARIAGMIQRGELLPGARILICGPDYTQLADGTLKTFDKWFGRDGLNIITHAVDGNTPRRELVNGIEVLCRSAMNPDQTRSKECQLVWLDECAQMDEEVFTLTNLILRQFGDHAPYQTLLTSTPRGRNWLWRTFLNPETRKWGEEKVGYYHTTTLEAAEHGIVRQSYVEEGGYLPGTDKWKQEIEADFLSWGGLVFDKFHPVRHCPDPFVLPVGGVTYGGIDVGYGGWTALILTRLNPVTGQKYTFKEWYKRGAVPAEWMTIASDWTKEYSVRRWYIDAAANIEFRAMQSAGLPVFQSMKAKDAAGSAVSYINGEFVAGRMQIDRRECPMLVSEMDTYRYRETQSGDEVTFLEKVVQNQPDHAIDAWRYHVLPLSNVAHRAMDVEDRFTVASFR